MSVNTLPEFSNYPSAMGDNQRQTKTGKEADIELTLPPTEKQDTDPATITKPDSITNAVVASKDEQEMDNRAILERLSVINEQFPLKATSLIFEFDDANDPPVIKVVDKESGDVIRELPPKELREIAQALSDIADNLNGQAHKLQDKHSSGILINERL